MQSERDPKTLRRLRERLAELFDSDAKVRMLLRDVGVSWERVESTGSVEVRWFSALAEAEHQALLPELIACALLHYPSDAILREIAAELGDEAERHGRHWPGERIAWSGVLAEVVPCIELRERRNDRALLRRTAFPLPFDEAVEVSWRHEYDFGSYLVGALRAAPAETDIDVFAEHCNIWKQTQARPGWCRLLYVGQPCEEALRRRARGCEIDLQSLAEYAGGLIDFKSYVSRQAGRLRSHPHYQPEHYIDARVTRLKSGGNETFDDALAQVREWMDTADPRLLVILGDFGAGKSFLMRELARRLAEERVQRAHAPVPLLIEMRDFHKSPKLNALLAQHLVDHDITRSDVDALRYMVREGRVVLLFDGFDELAQRLTFDRAADHLKTIVEAVDGRAKVLLTSRSQHFRSDEQVRSALVETIARAPYVMARLEPFTRKQIRAFFAKRLGVELDGQLVEERMTLLDQVHDLAGLGQNPRMLSFIADLKVEQLRAAAAEGGEITSAKLYGLLVDKWLAHERDRKDLPGARAGLTDVQLVDAVERLSLRFWGQVERCVSSGELEDVVRETLAAYPTPTHEAGIAAAQVGSASLLSRDGEDRFSFFHQSVMEWLIAGQVARDWVEGRASALVERHAFLDLTPKFLVEMVGDDIGAKQVRALELSESLTARENATRVVARLRKPAIQRLDLHGQDLRAMDLAPLLDRLTGANLQGCELSGVRLRGVSLRGADLGGARLRHADLTGSDLTDVDLTCADLTGAKLTGAVLSNARFEGATVARVSVVGATVSREVEAWVVAGGGAPMKAGTATPCWMSDSPLRAVAFAPLGGLLAAASGHDVWVVEVETSTILRVLRGHEGPVQSVAFNSDAKLLATGSGDGTARLWEVSSGRERASLRGHEGPVQSVAFSSDGKLLATGSGDGTARLWEISTSRERASLRGHTGAVQSVAFSPDGKLLATSSGYRTARLWEVSTGRERASLGHESWVQSVAFSPDGTLLATGSDDGIARLWEISTGRERASLRGHGGWVQSVAFNADGTLLATGSSNGTARLWEVSTGRERALLRGHVSPVRSVDFNADGTLLVTGSGDGAARLWEVSTGRERVSLRGHTSPVQSVAFRSDGTLLATSLGDGTARLWEVSTGRERGLLRGHAGSVQSVAFSSDGKLLATGSGDGTARLWEVSTSRERALLRGHEGPVQSVAFRSDGTFLVTGSGDGTARLWEVSTGREDVSLRGHQGPVQSVAFSPDGTLVATGSDDGTARLWEVSTGREGVSLRGHQGPVQSVAFSPDGSLMATGSGDGTARLWEVRKGRVRTSLGRHGGWVRSVAFSPDGTLLATGADDGAARLWELSTGRERASLRGHGGWVRSVAFNADGTLLATTCHDGNTRLWRVSDGKCLMILTSVGTATLAFTPDGPYRHNGNLRGYFWHAINLCRFEPGELDAYLGLRRTDGVPLLTLPEPPSVPVRPHGR